MLYLKDTKEDTKGRGICVLCFWKNDGLFPFFFNFPEIFHFLFPQKTVDVFQVFRHFPVTEFIDFFYQAIEKIPVVGDDNQCPVEVDQGIFKYVFCF